MTVAGQAVILTTRVETSVEVETSTPPEPVGCAVAVTGQTVVETTMVSVTTEVERAGQSVTVVGQAVMVLVRVEKMVEVVEPRVVAGRMVEVTVVKDPEPEELELELEIVPEVVPAEPVDVPLLVQGRVERVGVLLIEMAERLTGEVPVLWTALELAIEAGLVEREIRHGVREPVGLRMALELGIDVGIMTAELLGTTLELGMTLELGIMGALLGEGVGVAGELAGVVTTALVLTLELEVAVEVWIELELVMVMHAVVS